MSRLRHVAALVGLLAVLASPGGAQETQGPWYAGVGVSRLYTRFNPQYLTFASGQWSGFKNRKAGLQAEALLGRRIVESGRLSLSVQATVMANAFHWELSIPSEPADLQYSLPWAGMITLLPAIRLTDRVSFAAEVGGGAGRVHQLKTSSTSSAYNADHVRAALSLGGGFQVRVNSRFELFARYRYLRYGVYAWNSYGPSGVGVEHVRDAPRSGAVTLGIVRRF